MNKADCICELKQIRGVYAGMRKEYGSCVEALDMAINALEQTTWIPCSERLPEPRTDVWTCSDIGQIQGYYEENVGVWYASFGQGRDYLELYVTAWMPLPDPWKGEI